MEPEQKTETQELRKLLSRSVECITWHNSQGYADQYTDWRKKNDEKLIRDIKKFLVVDD